MGKQGREIFKNILIVVLSLGVVMLTITAYSDSSLAGAERLQRMSQQMGLRFRDQRYRLEYASESLTAATAAKPVTISVRNSFGRQTVRRDAAALEASYEAMGGLLGEALESAAEAKEVKKSDWRAALQLPSVYYLYSAPLPTKLLGSWLEVESALACRADRLLLCLEGQTVVLYCAVEEGFLRASTALEAARFTELTETCRPDGSAFALELDEKAYRHLDGESLLTRMNRTAVPAVLAENPADAALNTRLAGLLSFNPYGQSTYTTSDGTQIFEESERSMSVTAAGLLTVRNSGVGEGRFLAEADTDEALVEYARALLEELCGESKADGRLQLTGIQRDGGEVVLEFDYFVSGIRVQTTTPHAARLLFSGRRLSEVSLLLRRYTLTGESLPLLPERQAAAIVEPGVRLQIHYRDPGTGALSAGWSRE